MSNVGEMKIALRTSKQRSGSYPKPGDASNITYSGSGIAYQGLFNQSLAINTISQIPTDPKLTNKYYSYSTTWNRQNFQIGLSMEQEGGTWYSYVDGDYRPVAKTILPSLFTSTGAKDPNPATIDVTPGAGDANRKTFIFKDSTSNLFYDNTGTPKINTTLDFTGILNEATGSVVESTDYTSCMEIFEAGRSVGSGTYTVIDGDGIASGTGCSMDPLTNYK
jgi:hypothetical protein